MMVNIPSMESMHTDARARDWLRKLRLDSCDAFLKIFAPDSPGKTAVVVAPRTVDGRSVFFKLYEYAAPSWNFWVRRSKARCEFENYAAFETLGIPTARRIACGEIRDAFGRLRRAFILTEAIPRAWTLPQFVGEHCPNRATAESRPLRDGLCRQLATLTRWWFLSPRFGLAQHPRHVDATGGAAIVVD